MNLTTESNSNHDSLEQLSSMELISIINQEDQTVPHAIAKELKTISFAIDLIYDKMKTGGRLFYIGSGTSGRLGIVDASECPPTFGVPHDWVIGIIAGGDKAIRKAVEFAEDDTEQGFKDLQAHQISEKDIVVGISASGTTPYVYRALAECKKNNISCISVACNKSSKIGQIADIAIEVVVGPEVVTGSTRMKSGTAQKLILNMITTSVMIKLGRVQGNKMVDMQLSNDKLVNRATRMVMDATGSSKEEAESVLAQIANVRLAIKHIQDKTK